MSKATIIVCVDDPAEVAAADAWFARWRNELTRVSDNQGCGCRVDIWEVEGPVEALEELPTQACNTNQDPHWA